MFVICWRVTFITQLFYIIKEMGDAEYFTAIIKEMGDEEYFPAIFQTLKVLIQLNSD